MVSDAINCVMDAEREAALITQTAQEVAEGRKNNALKSAQAVAERARNEAAEIKKAAASEAEKQAAAILAEAAERADKQSAEIRKKADINKAAAIAAVLEELIPD